MSTPEIKIPIVQEQQELLDKLIKETGSAATRAVSFRMMGTLVILPMTSPEDIFSFMEEDFRDVYRGKYTFMQIRTAAEDEAVKKYRGKCSVSIEQIYDIIMKRAKLSFNACEKLMNRECELVEFFSMPRGMGKRLYEEARRKSKKTVILADSVYPKQTVDNILKKCGYGFGNVVYARDTDCGLSADEALFAQLLEKGHVTAERLLNIGGNVASDVELPIMKGAKALLLANVSPMMVKSGRLRGYIQAKCVYDMEQPDHLALRCAMGLCAAYLFDIPRHKVVRSDFCASPYILGFTAWGPLKLIKGYIPSDDQQEIIIKAMASNDEMKRGMEDFLKLFDIHFSSHLLKFGYKDCDLPLKFLTEHSSPGDRQLFDRHLDGTALADWALITKEPSLAPVYEHKPTQNAAARLVDRLFPPGTKVRNMADGMMVKIKSRGKV